MYNLWNTCKKLLGGLWVLLLPPIVLAFTLDKPTYISIPLLILVTMLALWKFKAHKPPFSLQTLIGFLIVFLFLLIFQNVTSTILESTGLSISNQEETIKLLKDRYWVMVVYTCFTAPIVEELVCRHHIMSSLSNPLWGCALSVLVFVAIHGFTIPALLTYGGMSLFMLFLYSKYGVWYSIGLHMMNNILALLIFTFNI